MIVTERPRYRKEGITEGADAIVGWMRWPGLRPGRGAHNRRGSTTLGSRPTFFLLGPLVLRYCVGSEL